MVDRPSAFISSNIPKSTATCGNMVMPRMVKSSNRRPRNRIRANAAAANTPRPSDMATLRVATMIEFCMFRPNGWATKTAR